MKRIFLMVLATVSMALSSYARYYTASAQPLSVSMNDIYTQNGNLVVSLDLDFSNLEVGKNQQVVFTPVIMSADGSQYAAFDKVVVNGRNTSIIQERKRKKSAADVAACITRDNGSRQSYSYTGSVPYQTWMENSKLYINEDVCGCGDLESQESEEVAEFHNEPVSFTETVVEMMVPPVEESKRREEKGSAYIDFIVNRYNIDPDYMNNRQEINKILSTINLVKDDRNVEITNIDIHGYASPEGAYSHNAFLAEERTKSLTNYVKSLYTLPASIFSQQSTPENWEGLKKLVEASHIENRDAILAIINDNNIDPDAKDRMIKSQFPQTYAFMLSEWYPMLRRSDYTISYVVRPFTPEEALEVMKVSPNQVSLYEMFRAASTLPQGSPEYVEAIELAQKTYPDQPAANFNAAVVAANAGNYDRARQLLSNVPESGETLNLLGTMALKSGDLDSAESFFTKASSRGVTSGEKNIELIRRMKQLKKQNR